MMLFCTTSNRQPCAGWFGRLLAVLLLAVAATCPLAARGAENGAGAALMLYSFDDSLPWQRLLRTGLIGELMQTAPAIRPTLFEERVDGQRLGFEAATERLEAYLTRKYAGIRIDTVVTESYFATAFLRDHPNLFPGAQRYYVNDSIADKPPTDGVRISVAEDFAAAIASIRSVMPRLRRLIVVADRTPVVQARMETMRPALDAVANQVAVEIWDDYGYAELYQRAGKLARDTAILFLGAFRDKTGAASVPLEVARNLAAAATVPVFVHYDSQMSPGLTGGYMLSSERLGRLIAGLLLGRAAGDPAAAANIGRQAYSHIFDYTAFERFKLDLTHLPDGSTMLNRPTDLWQAYRWQILGALAVFTIQSVLMVALLMTLRGRSRALVALGEEQRRVAEHAEELRRHKDHLEDLVKERTSELEVALAQAETANRAKSTFLANMSHELRTPLTAVIGFSRLMAEDPTAPATFQRNLSIINRSGNHLLTLINDILTLSKIEAGRQALVEQVADPIDLVTEVSDMMRVRAWEKGLTLTARTTGLPAGIVVDAAKLRQVLLNLLSNAVKFTENGGVILEVVAGPLEDGKVRLGFVVADTGIGISLVDQAYIFEPFVQGNIRAAQSGTGLGLAISREFVRMMGGELELDSAPGLGATFRFTVTVAAAAGPVAGSESAGQVVGIEGQAPDKRILLVDDNPDTRLLLRSLLSPLGFAIAEADQGDAAVQTVAAFHPDLVLMDWRMPGRHGLEATRCIRALEGSPQPKIAMLTASAFEEDRQIALEAGADDFLRKPFHHDALFALLERHLGIRFRRQTPVIEPAVPEVEVDLTGADLAVLPAPVRSALAEAARELSAAKLSDVVASIGREHPEIAARIQSLTEAAKFRELVQMLEGACDA